MSRHDSRTYQDWEPVTITRRTTAKEARKKSGHTQRNLTGGTNTNNPRNYRKSVDEDDIPKRKKIDKSMGVTIQKARAAMDPPMKRKDLAAKCCIGEKLLGLYENGKVAIPGHHQVKIAKRLGLKTLKNGGVSKSGT